MSWRRLGVVVLAACACTTHDAPGDGAVDAGADVRLADAGHDGGHDAAAVDVGTDGPDAALPDGWRGVTGSFPATTQLAFAEPSLVASTAFPIEPCPDRAGCRRIVQSWPSGVCTGPPYSCSPFAVPEASGDHDGTSGTVIIGRQSSADHVESWIVDDAGRARAGFRSAVYPQPEMGAVDVHGNCVAVNVYAGSVGGDYEDFMLVVPVDMPFSFIDLGEVNHLTPGGSDTVQRAQLSESAIAAEMTSLVVQRIPLDGSAPAVVTDGEGTLGAIVGETIFHDTARGSGDNVIHVARPGAASEAFVSGPLTHSYRVATDGTDLVWLEFDLDATSTATNYQIWTSPYAEHAADLVPRRLDSPAVVSVTTPIRVGYGYAAAPDGLGGLRIYRLADDHHADLPPPSGEIWFAPAYVGPTEIAVAAHRFADPSYTTQLCFIELDSLDWQPTP